VSGFVVRKKQRPAKGFERVKKDMRLEDVCVIGELTPTFRMTDRTRLKMESLQII